MDVREVNRKLLWRELKMVGWSARPPRGLEVDYLYVPPGGNATGADGTDYFLGTAGVIQHYLDSRQTEAEDADDGAEDASVDVEEAPGERSDHAGDGKEGPGEENDEQSDREPDAAAKDDDGDDGYSHEGDAASASDEETKAEAPSSHARTLRRRSSRVRPGSALTELVIEEDAEVADTPIEDAVADTNTLPSGDNPEDFDALDSGDEPERDDFDKDQQFDSAFAFAGGDSDSDSGSASDDDVGAPRYQEELFNEAFLRDIGGLSAIDSGAMNSDALRQMGGRAGTQRSLSTSTRCSPVHAAVAVHVLHAGDSLERDRVPVQLVPLHHDHQPGQGAPGEAQEEAADVDQDFERLQGVPDAAPAHPRRRAASHGRAAHCESDLPQQGASESPLRPDLEDQACRRRAPEDVQEGVRRTTTSLCRRRDAPVVLAVQQDPRLSEGQTTQVGNQDVPHLLCGVSVLPQKQHQSEQRPVLDAAQVNSQQTAVGQAQASGKTIDMKAGPTAVVRNMLAVLGRQHNERYVVATDRFYTCASLATQLLSMNVYLVGTCMANR
ncbi:unnamed protein product [Phytophthora fragariaefolia]|uniref:Unnamed protein product n=1 Tax=Phytophthora fragariaefolia TaxID=1490495 RepID=A0A9W7D3B1_9STRA|nr:unnamed protein product [Phytophthora fragariaefolia]